MTDNFDNKNEIDKIRFFIKKEQSKKENKDEKRIDDLKIKLSRAIEDNIRALIDFYGDQILAHAGYLTAFFFGIFTILQLFRENSEILNIILVSDILWLVIITTYITLRFFMYVKFTTIAKEALGLISGIFRSTNNSYTEIWNETFNRTQRDAPYSFGSLLYLEPLRFIMFLQKLYLTGKIIFFSIPFSLFLLVCTILAILDFHTNYVWIVFQIGIVFALIILAGLFVLGIKEYRKLKKKQKALEK